MKKALLTLSLLIACAGLHAQTDTLLYTPEYLDTVDVSKALPLNDYALLGINYGVTFSTVYFNPSKGGATFRFRPTYFSLMFTHYEKMFNFIPYFGVTCGVSYSHEGVRFDYNEKTGLPLGYLDGATDVTYDTIEVPAMMQMHFDSGVFKLLANLGGYAGYRLSVERSGEWMDPEYANKFRDYDYRFDYGLMGGAGFGLMFDPIEFHVNALARWSLRNLYAPDYYNPTFHPNNTYYYRYANPIDIFVTAGVYIQLSKRTGKTLKEIKQMAKDIVYGTAED